jgi:hypothetical protein
MSKRGVREILTTGGVQVRILRSLAFGCVPLAFSEVEPTRDYITPSIAMLWLAVCVIFVLGTLLHLSIKKRWLQKHNREVQAYAKEHRLSTNVGKQTALQRTNLLRTRYEAIQNGVRGRDWLFFEHIHIFTNVVPLGVSTEPMGKIYSAVMSTDLPQAFPNIFFSSSKHGRARRVSLERSQRRRFGNDIDKNFTSYFSGGNTPDSVGFVSDKMTAALCAASEYDIEIYQNHLTLHSPLLDPNEQIPDMAAKLGAIKEALVGSLSLHRTELPESNAELPILKRRNSMGTLILYGILVVLIVILWIT